MKTERILWIGVAVYFVVIAGIYKLVGGEPAGVAVLLFAGAFGGLVGGWMWNWSKTHTTPRSDGPDGDIGDAEPEVGMFAESSIRPLGIGGAMCMMFLGVPIGSWMLIAGVALLGSQVGLMIRDRDA